MVQRGWKGWQWLGKVVTAWMSLEWLDRHGQARQAMTRIGQQRPENNNR